MSQRGKGTKFIDSISVLVPGETKYGQSLGKCLLKSPANLKLNGEGPFTICLVGFPTVDGSWNDYTFVDRAFSRCVPHQCSLNTRGIQFPFGNQPIGRETTLQSR